MITRLCFATNNAHKIEEVRALLGQTIELLNLHDIGCFEELPEDCDTIKDNSFQKAEYVFNHYNVACFADDTGLEVEALNNAPGVFSARYAGPQRNPGDNIDLLLENMQGVNNRAACFKTVVTLIQSGGTIQFEGILPGVILRQRRGSGGFGYDPLFLPQGHSKTLAEMELGEKNKISHRGRAIGKLVNFLHASQSVYS